MVHMLRHSIPENVDTQQERVFLFQSASLQEDENMFRTKMEREDLQVKMNESNRSLKENKNCNKRQTELVIRREKKIKRKSMCQQKKINTKRQNSCSMLQ